MHLYIIGRVYIHARKGTFLGFSHITVDENPEALDLLKSEHRMGLCFGGGSTKLEYPVRHPPC
jgi:hypothetical protein